MCNKLITMMIPLAEGQQLDMTTWSFNIEGTMQVQRPCGTVDHWHERHLCKRCKGNAMVALRTEDKRMSGAEFTGFVRRVSRQSRKAMAEARRNERKFKRMLGADYE